MFDALVAVAPALRIEPWHVWLAAELVEHATEADPSSSAGLLALVATLLGRVDAGDVLVPIPGMPRAIAGADDAGPDAETVDAGAVADLCAALGGLPGDDTHVACVQRAIEHLVAIANGAADGPFAAVCARADAETDHERPLVVDGGGLYVHRLHRAEVRLGEAIARRAARTVGGGGDAAIEAAVSDVCARPAQVRGTSIALADEQVRAVRAACASPVAVVSGGPGTGKTSVVVAILRALVRLGVDPARIALAAPTGKAAWRMGEALEHGLGHVPPDRRAAADVRLVDAALEPRTLHRLLRWSPGASRFEHGESLPLPADAVIVDESSMVPLALMDRLVAAVAPDARLILLGDADQLPSVEAGSVFADLAPPRGAPPTPVARSSIRLVRSFRMREDDPAGRAVLTVARRIRDGDTALEVARAEGQPAMEVVDAPDALRGFGVEAIDARGAALESVVVDRLVDALFGDPERREAWLAPVERADGGFDAASDARLHAVFDRLESTRVLCVTRRGPRGTDAVGARIDARVRALDPRAALGVGAPILVTRNDPRRGLFNGDLGIVLDVRAPGAPAPTPRVVFRRGDSFATFAPAALAVISR